MAKFELKLPKMGESVAEATITNWLKGVGDTIEADEPVLEIATDKVDSEVPSEIDGVLVEKLFDTDAVVQVGQTIAIIEGKEDGTQIIKTPNNDITSEVLSSEALANITDNLPVTKAKDQPVSLKYEHFYSPLVKNIAKKEGVSQAELDTISGTGLEGRVTKNDIIAYIKQKQLVPNFGTEPILDQHELQTNNVQNITQETSVNNTYRSGNETLNTAVSSGDEILEMSRMGKLIAKHMVDSVRTSVHVQSFIEADVTTVWNWRNKHKTTFEKREGEKLTFTPIFMEAVSKALLDFPMMNISVKGDKIIKKKNINLGMAVAIPDGNLLVPVIKDADQLNLLGMTKKVNDLANRARIGKLNPDEIQNGTYTVTNVGAFGSIMGTPIINQPQVGILALGTIRKVPAVIETPEGDFIGIRYRMFLSHSFDHRVVNGALGGQFVKAVKDYLESWDMDRHI